MDVSALEHPPTRRALRIRAAVCAAALLLSIAVALWLSWLGAITTLVAIGAAIHLLRVRSTLARHEWRPWQCRFVTIASKRGSGYPTLLLSEDGFDHVLSPSIFVWNGKPLAPFDHQEVWFAGDPSTAGLASPPGGATPLWFYRPRSGRRRLVLLDAAREA